MSTAGVVQLGHEPLVQISQTVYEFAVPGLGRDDRDVRHLLAQVATDAHERAGSAEAGHEMRDGRQVGEQFWAGGFVVRAGVVRISVLVEHHPVGMVGGQHLRGSNCGVRSARRRGGDDLRPVGPKQQATLLRGVLRHHADEPVALDPADHRQRDTGVATGRLDDRATRPQATVSLGSRHHRQRRAVLDGAGRIAVLELGPHPDLR